MKLSSQNLFEGATYLGHDSSTCTIERIHNGHVWCSGRCVPVWQFLVWAKELLILGERKDGESDALYDLQPRSSRSRFRGRDTRENRKVARGKKKWTTDDF